MSGAKVQLTEVSLQAAVGAQFILNHLSLTVEPGDRLAIVGPSGSGKTHLLRLINRLSEPTSGQITLNGQDLRQIPAIALRRRVALVLQESRLLGMTVAEALRYPLRLQGCTPTEIQQRLDTWIERMRLPGDWMASTEPELSVGQRQWVAIARALIQQPEVLLLDEPTSALDVGRGEALMTLLLDLSATTGLTILMVTHQLELAARGCNRLIYLKQGQIVDQTAAPGVDWEALRQDLVETEQQQTEEWGEL